MAILDFRRTNIRYSKTIVVAPTAVTVKSIHGNYTVVMDCYLRRTKPCMFTFKRWVLYDVLALERKSGSFTFFKEHHHHHNLTSDYWSCLRADVSYFLCCTRKRDVCVTPSLIVFQRPAGFPRSWEHAVIGWHTERIVWLNADWLSSNLVW